MILIIDNYDSFVYNLARYVARLGRKHTVKRNDAISIDEIGDLTPEAIIISPGPCTPKEAGISLDVIKHFGEKIPILGVCLGHQAIGEVYDGKTIRADKPVHGKSSIITHDDSALFEDIPSPVQVGRYHSLTVSLPEKSDNNPLIITARCESNNIMAMNHKTNPVYGVQFHPESVLTPKGDKIIKNFLNIADTWNKTHQ